ncbi:hypothetical protein ONZ43_g3199 [Nemania bipapillata]|uniref:Uncharacterized protein n=1 Tax=Nemania bipapillata TaxID=110536 RepID=A0ACC2IXN8_9PEZI|nr:hypothetical protein ONZ43_g3199 [Nemania bipapillata]
MNTQFNSALKQSTSIKRDLAGLSSSSDGAPTPAVLGSLSASLTAFSRTLDEYSALAKQELNPAKQEKAHERLRNFRTELSQTGPSCSAPALHHLDAREPVRPRLRLAHHRHYGTDESLW